MSTEDYNTILVENSVVSDITSTPTLYIEDNIESTAFYNINFTTYNNSNMNLQYQAPSWRDILDRNVEVQTYINSYLTLTNVPIGQSCFQLGNTDYFQSFPFNKLINTSSLTLNSVQTNFNSQYIIDEVLRTADQKLLSKYKDLTPTYQDSKWGMFSDAIGTNSNVLASSSNSSYDQVLQPRGAFNGVTFFQIDHYVAGTYTDSSTISTATSDTWIISVQLYVTEPLIGLNPFSWDSQGMEGGLFGINAFQLNLVIDSGLTRLWSTANTTTGASALTSYITSVNAGLSPRSGNVSTAIINRSGITSSTTSLFSGNPQLLMRWYTPSAIQLSKIGVPKNVHEIVEYTPFITQSSYTITSGSSYKFTTNSIQLQNLPNRIYVFVRIPSVSTGNFWNYTKSYLTITQLNIQFANKQGILDSATQSQLYEISKKNGSKQTWEEFSGYTCTNNNTNGAVNVLPTIGSLMVLDPTRDFNVESFLANGSMGQYNVYCNITCTNQFPFSITPEVVLITEVNGIMSLQEGTGSKYIGNVTQDMVLRAKSKTDVISDYDFLKKTGGAVSSKINLIRRLFRKKKMAIQPSGGNIGGQSVGGGSKLSRHLSSM